MSLEIPPVSSLSLASPPAPTRYFDLLPPELVQLVVERTVDREVQYSERQATLRSLCLTSKSLKSIASPILLSDVRIAVNMDKLQQLARNNDPAALVAIKKLNLLSEERPLGFGRPGESYDPTDIFALLILASNVPRLEELSCTLYDNELTLFPGSNIVTLALKDISFRHYSFMFPQVKFLSLDNCSFKIRPDRFLLPSLRHLAYTPFNTCIPLSFDEIDLFNGFSNSPLCSITVPCWLHTSELPDKFITSAPICYSAPSDRYFLKHVTEHLQTFSLCGPSLNNSELPELVDWVELEETASKLETLILPPLVNAEQDPTLVEKEAKLLQICQRRQIRVVREESNEGSTFWDSVSPWFIKESEKFRDERLRGMLVT